MPQNLVKRFSCVTMHSMDVIGGDGNENGAV